jgi:hypothetical protein
LNIVGWLRQIGLAQYAEAFRASDIDGDPLSRLTTTISRTLASHRGAIAKSCWRRSPT